MGCLLSDVHSHNIITIGRIDVVKLITHLILRTECLDDTESTQRLVHHTHGITPKRLRFDTLRFQLTTYPSHKPANGRNNNY